MLSCCLDLVPPPAGLRVVRVLREHHRSLLVAETMIEVGTKLGALTVTRVDSETAGVVMAEASAADGSLRRVRALPLNLTSDHAEALQTFEARTSAAAQIRHESSQRPLEWAAQPVAFVATEVLEATPLHDRLEQGASSQFAIAIGVDIAGALAAAHAAGVVHANVSPGAILLDRRGRAWLTDFGIGALVAQIAQEHTHLLTAVIDSLAPEFAQSLEPTCASDVFALGTLLYRIIEGVSPFDAPSPLGVTLKVSMVSYAPIESSPDVPEGLRSIVHSMLQSQPGDRPDAARVHRELSHLMPHEHERRRALRPDAGPVRSSGAPALAAAPEVPASPIAPVSVAPVSVAPARVAPARVVPTGGAPGDAHSLDVERTRQTDAAASTANVFDDGPTILNDLPAAAPAEPAQDPASLPSLPFLGAPTRRDMAATPLEYPPDAVSSEWAPDTVVLPDSSLPDGGARAERSGAARGPSMAMLIAAAVAMALFLCVLVGAILVWARP